MLKEKPMNKTSLRCDMCDEVIPEKKGSGFEKHDCSPTPVMPAPGQCSHEMGDVLAKALKNTRAEPVIMGRWDL